MVEFGERIYNLRRKSGLSQEEFAIKLGVSRQAVSKWETGQSVPDSEKAAAIGAYFGVSLDWLINGAEPAAPVAAPVIAETDESDVQPVAADDSQAAPAPEVRPVKKKSGIVRALIIAGIVTLAFIGVNALSAFIFMLAVMKSADLADPSTFYMLLIVVPGWAVTFLIAFIVSVIVIMKKKKKKENKPPQ
ncbi:MAG: helix-turn-helix domain-containing protein [Clostridia bacterium]|nr:helix-turn-helix domain-containing protein [Clostridia bacterium]